MSGEPATYGFGDALLVTFRSTVGPGSVEVDVQFGEQPGSLLPGPPSNPIIWIGCPPSIETAFSDATSKRSDPAGWAAAAVVIIRIIPAV